MPPVGDCGNSYAGWDTWVDLGDCAGPQPVVDVTSVIAESGGGFAVSLSTGEVVSSNPQREALNLANLQPRQDGSFIGTNQGNQVTNIVTGASRIFKAPDSPFPGFGYGFSGEAAATVWVDNKSDGDVVVKDEDCDQPFVTVQRKRQYRARPIDGVKPPFWTPRLPDRKFSQDWYKVLNQVSVTIEEDGTVTKHGVGLVGMRNALLWDCNYDGSCRHTPGDIQYRDLGGRKLEPQWSNGFTDNDDPYSAPVTPDFKDKWFWDWRYVDPPQPQRRFVDPHHPELAGWCGKRKGS